MILLSEEFLYLLKFLLFEDTFTVVSSPKHIWTQFHLNGLSSEWIIYNLSKFFLFKRVYILIKKKKFYFIGGV